MYDRGQNSTHNYVRLALNVLSLSKINARIQR